MPPSNFTFNQVWDSDIPSDLQELYGQYPLSHPDQPDALRDYDDNARALDGEVLFWHEGTSVGTSVGTSEGMERAYCTQPTSLATTSASNETDWTENTEYAIFKLSEMWLDYE
jgi:hypothetical protein